MVVIAAETPTQAEVIFAIEATSYNGAYINELKTNYIIPTLEYFQGFPMEELGKKKEEEGSGCVYCVVTYKSADCHPGQPVSTFGPFTCSKNVLEAVDKIQFNSGQCDARACVIEALHTSMLCFEELGRNDVSKHILLVCCSPPYSSYAGGLAPPGAPATLEQAALQLSERGIHLSLAAARRIQVGPLLDRNNEQPRNYAKDPRHMVVLRGYSLKERPPSPAPPPAPEIQTDIYGAGRGAVGGNPNPGIRTPGGAFPRAAVPGGVGPQVAGAGPQVGGVGAPGGPSTCRSAWLAPRQPIYNSALLSQLAQPSYPPPSQPNLQRMPNMVSAGVSGVGGAAPSAGPSGVAGGGGAGALPQRTFIWSGVLEWMEKGKQDQQKMTKQLPCQVSANSKDIEPDLKVDTWPNKLLMQLMPKQLISSIGGQYLKDSKSVLFHLQPNEALDALTKVMVSGFAGCVHFSPTTSPPQCDIRVLILLYTPEKKAYLGFIPNHQVTFVDRLRKVIQQQKITQLINKQPTLTGSPGGIPSPMPNANMQGTMPTAGMSTSGMPNPGMSTVGMPNPGMANNGMALAGMSQGMPNQGMPNQGMPTMSAPGMPNPGISQPGMAAMNNPGMAGALGGMGGVAAPGLQPANINQHQGMMPGGGQANMGGGKGARGGATQLDGLEAARQQNLEKIQQLQQTLEAAHQQEAQFKSQMSQINQHDHYKFDVIEQQRKQHQLQQQLQQQLRGAAPRGIRPLMPSNPGLRHLLQQQPQYRPGGTGPRPNSQSQQFDDVNSYDFI